MTKFKRPSLPTPEQLASRKNKVIETEVNGQPMLVTVIRDPLEL